MDYHYLKNKPISTKVSSAFDTLNKIREFQNDTSGISRLHTIASIAAGFMG